MNAKIQAQIDKFREENKPEGGYSEHDDCVCLVEHLKDLQEQGKIEKFTHVSNETFTKSWSQKLKLKQEGVCSGVPD
jgi:hypothetical protein